MVLLFYIAIFHIFVNTSSGSIEQYLSASPPHLYLKLLAQHVSWLPSDSNVWLTVLFVAVVINSLVLLTWVFTQVIFLVLCMEILTMVGGRQSPSGALVDTLVYVHIIYLFAESQCGG